MLTVQEQTHYVSFWKWSSVTLILIFNFTSHNGKLKTGLPWQLTSTRKEYKVTLISATNAITKHSFFAKCEASFQRAKKESLKANEVIVLADFAENYQFLVQDEIQSYHWSKEYCTLHPLAVHFIDCDGNIQQFSLFHLG